MGGDSGGRVAPLLRQPLFVASSVLYCGYQVATRLGHWVPPTWVGSWLADVLCLPVVLTLGLAAQRAVRRRPHFVLPDAWVAAAWAYVSVWFELLAPRWQPARFTADWWDVLAYALGAVIFRVWLNQAPAKVES